MPNITNTLVALAGQIGPDIYYKTLDSSIWLKMIDQEAWPDGMGSNLNVLMYNRSIVANATDWSAVSINNGSGNTCAPTATVMGTSTTLRTYSLFAKAVESNPICVNDVRFGFQFKEQLTRIYDMLVANVAYIWKLRYRNQYVDLCEHKLTAVLEGSRLREQTAWSQVVGGVAVKAPVSTLTQGILDHIYMQLNRDGAREFAAGMENGAPVYTLITSAETSHNIIQQNREDFRYTTARVNELYQPLGVERSYRGYYHIIDDFPRRYNITNSGVNAVWTEVPPYISVPDDDNSDSTTGVKSIINPAYDEALYEESIIFLKDVMKSMVPKPLTAPGGNTNFAPINYRGEFKFLNYPTDDNPDQQFGRFRGVLQNGAKPVHPEFGYVIRHLRCPVGTKFLTCAGLPPA